MNDTEDHPALTEINAAIWPVAVEDPTWFTAHVAPILVGTLVAISQGYLSDSGVHARKAIADVIALCEAKAARG